jgi:hypothetical protein
MDGKFLICKFVKYRHPKSFYGRGCKPRPAQNVRDVSAIKRYGRGCKPRPAQNVRDVSAIKRYGRGCKPRPAQRSLHPLKVLVPTLCVGMPSSTLRVEF